MTKLVIHCRKDIIEECVQYLYVHNITFAALFPDLDGFARSLGDFVLIPERFHRVGDDAWRGWGV